MEAEDKPGRWRGRSLRARLTWGATAIFAVSVAVLAVLILLGVHWSTQSSVDTTARQRAQDIAVLAEAGKLTGTIPNTGDEVSAAQVLDATGKVVATSSNLEGNEPIMTQPLPPELLAGNAITRGRLAIGDGADYRILTAPTTMGGRPATVVVATSLAAQERTMAALTLAFAIGMPVLVGVLAVTTWVLTARTLRPVARLRTEVDEISATDLHQRLALPASRDEVHSLATTLNRMLARLETASTAQRRFVGDAAHELRSPLTAIIAEVENAVLHPETATWSETGPLLMTGLHRLESLIDDLLALARLDDPGHRPAPRDVDLDEIVLAEIGRARRATDHTIDARGVGAARVRGNPGELTRVVRNLVDNATRHAAGRIAVLVREAGESVELIVADDGPGIPAPRREYVFGRFTRLQEGRDRDSGGTGLGLAIVRELVDAHGGRAWVGPPDAERANIYPGAWMHIQLPNGAPR